MLSFLYKVLGITLPLVWSSRSAQNIIIAVLVAQFCSILLSTNPYIALHYELNCTISHSKSKFILLLFLIMGYYYCQLSYNVDYPISQLFIESFDAFCQPIPSLCSFHFSLKYSSRQYAKMHISGQYPHHSISYKEHS